MQRINRWLAEADIVFEGMVGSRDRVVNNTDRLLRRYFNNGSFEEGGRLFGGFWMQMKKRDRYEGIRIDGDEVISLDYGQMTPRLLYGHAGVTPPTEDAYTLPGLEFHRDGVKKVFNAMLYANKPLGRMPQGTRELFQRRVIVKEVVNLIIEKLAAAIGSSMGRSAVRPPAMPS
jgi:hypothetical protein